MSTRIDYRANLYCCSTLLITCLVSVPIVLEIDPNEAPKGLRNKVWLAARLQLNFSGVVSPF